MSKPSDLVRGTLDMLILKILASEPPQWLGDQPAPETDLERCAAGQRWLSLPGAAQAGTRGLDYRSVEIERKQSSRQVLFANPTRAETAPKGGRPLGPPLRRHHQRRKAQGGLSHALRT